MPILFGLIGLVLFVVGMNVLDKIPPGTDFSKAGIYVVLGLAVVSVIIGMAKLPNN